MEISENKTKEKLEEDLLQVNTIVEELNKNNKMCWLDQCELARKHGMKPFQDYTADQIFYNNNYIICYDRTNRLYTYRKYSV